MDAALVLMDYQVGLCRSDGSVGGPSGLAGEVERRDVLSRAAACLDAARGAGLTVVHVRVAFDADYHNRTNRSSGFDDFEANGLLQAGDPQAEICDEVAPHAGEVVLAKGCVNPFIGAPLDAVLRVRGARTLYLGGVATNFVVESAARHAGDSGYDVVVLEDLCASFSKELHETAVEATLPLFAEVRTSASLIEALERSG